MCFIGVMLIPIAYYLFIPVWLCKKWTERCQFWAGCVMYVFCGPFINIAVLVYAMWNMDSFGWGKTRKVIIDPESSLSAPSQANEDNQGAADQEKTEMTALSAVRSKVDDVVPRRGDPGDKEKTVGIYVA